MFTATCVLHGTVDAGVEFHCEGRKLTLTSKVLRREDADGRHEVAVGRDPLVIADERFLSAVREQVPSLLVCDYADAVLTQELRCKVRDVADRPGRVERAASASPWAGRPARARGRVRAWHADLREPVGAGFRRAVGSAC